MAGELPPSKPSFVMRSTAVMRILTGLRHSSLKSVNNTSHHAATLQRSTLHYNYASPLAKEAAQLLRVVRGDGAQATLVLQRGDLLLDLAEVAVRPLAPRA